MPFDYLSCPHCGEKVKSYRNPFPTVDIIIEYADGIVLIERKNGHCRAVSSTTAKPLKTQPSERPAKKRP